MGNKGLGEGETAVSFPTPLSLFVKQPLVAVLYVNNFFTGDDKMDFQELEQWINKLENGQACTEQGRSVADLETACTELRNSVELLNKVALVEVAVSNAITLYKSAASHIKDTKTIQDRAKAVLTDIMMETGQLEWQTDAGRAYVPKPGVSVRYDAKKLDAVCEADPVLAEKLAPFRKVTERPGSLTIR